MKKIVLVLVLVFTAASLFAAPIPLGEFPTGRWLDNNYDAIWEFTYNNIRIVSPSGFVYYDFSAKTVENFRFSYDGDNPRITFSCPEAGRTYRFTIIRPENNALMDIDRPNQERYTVNMRRQ